MRKILTVAKRDYAETVRTKMFVVGILMTPLLLIGVVWFAGWTSRDTGEPRPAWKLAFIDLSGELTGQVRAAFDAYNAAHAGQRILLQASAAGSGTAPAESDLQAEIRSRKDELHRGELDAFVVLDKDVVGGPGPGGAGKMVIYTRGTKAADLGVLSAVENVLNQVVVAERCRLRGVSPELLAELTRRVPTERVDVGPGGREKRLRGEKDAIVGIMVPFFFMFLMFMGIFGMGQHMITSIIEEKSSRVIEVLLSALSPLELMAGKIVGLAGIGLTVVGLWCVAAFAAAVWQGVTVVVSPAMVVYFVIYYVLGFLLFTSILAGVGSVCNTIKEAQSLMMPLTLVFVLPMVGWLYLTQHPEGTLARVLSFVPPLTPLVMILRLAAHPGLSTWEVFASIAVLAASVPAVVWAAAKVFRTGILMYGKRPGLREVLRWIRQS